MNIIIITNIIITILLFITITNIIIIITLSAPSWCWSYSLCYSSSKTSPFREKVPEARPTSFPLSSNSPRSCPSTRDPSN